MMQMVCTKKLYFFSVLFMITGHLVDWWEPETKMKYLEKTRCIIEQYGNYSVEVGVVVKFMMMMSMTFFRLMVRL